MNDRSSGEQTHVDWTQSAEVALGLWRVTRGPEARWFVVNAQPEELQRWIGRGLEEVSVRSAAGETAAGLLVPRFDGGLLRAALASLGKLSAAQSSAVIAGCAEALESAPEAPAGYVRACADSFALDSHARVRLVPGMLQPAAPGIEAQAIADLTYSAAFGMTRVEAGAPAIELLRLAPADPPMSSELAGLIDDLFMGDCSTDDGALDADALAVRLRRCPAPAELPFFAAEPGIDPREAQTAGMRAIREKVFRAVTGEPEATVTVSREDQPEAGADAVRALRSAQPAGSTASRRNSTRRKRRSATSKRHRHRSADLKAAIRSPRVIAACCCALLVIAGGGLMLGSREESPSAAPTGASPAHTAPAPPASTSAPPVPDATGADPQAALHDRQNPDAAFRTLTALRARAFEAADKEALDELTVPGSPARKAEQRVPVSGYAGAQVVFDVADVAVEKNSQDEAWLRATMRTAVNRGEDKRSFGQQRLRSRLQFADGRWRVFETQQLE